MDVRCLLLLLYPAFVFGNVLADYPNDRGGTYDLDHEEIDEEIPLLDTDELQRQGEDTSVDEETAADVTLKLTSTASEKRCRIRPPTNREDVHTCILKKYKKDVLPAKVLPSGTEQAVSAKLHFLLQNVEYDADTRRASVRCIKTESWRDARLTWNVKKKEVEVIMVDLGSIWAPDLRPYNMRVPDTLKVTPGGAGLAQVYPNGTVVSVTSVVYVIPCSTSSGGRVTCSLFYGSTIPESLLQIATFPGRTWVTPELDSGSVGPIQVTGKRSRLTTGLHSEEVLEIKFEWDEDTRKK